MRRTTKPLVRTVPLTAGHVLSMRAGAWVSFQHLCEHRYKKAQGSVIPEAPSRYVDNGSLFFSYETCGALGSYNETRFSKGLAGIEIQAAIDRRDKYPNRVLRKLVTAAVHKFLFVKNSNRSNSKVPPELRDAFKDQSNWCTAESQARYNSSSCYSACAHDVALGDRLLNGIVLPSGFWFLYRTKILKRNCVLPRGFTKPEVPEPLDMKPQGPNFTSP